MPDCDVLVIGAGHNGLILANYLARAGLRVLVLESRLEAGGGLSTEELTLPGFWHNTHSYFHDTINVMPAYRDLHLEAFNARYYQPPVQAGLPLADGRGVTLHVDLDRTCRGLARFSPRDARTYREIREAYGEFMETVIIPALYSPAAAPSRQPAVLEKSPEGLEFLRLGRMSPRDVVDELFEDEHIKALLLHQLPIPRGVVHDYHGLGAVIPLVISQVEHSQLCLGGSHVLAHALWRALLRAGGQVLGIQHVERILVRDGAAVGVQVRGGRAFTARAVASAVDLQQTFLGLIGEEQLEEAFVRRIRGFKLDEFSIFGIHLALREPPRFRAAAFESALDQAFKLDVGLETPEDYERLWGEIRAGALPTRLGLYVSVPTLFDPSQAPRGHHTLLAWQPAPYALREGGAEAWDRVKEEFLGQCLDQLRVYAPNLTDQVILKAAALSPLDIERKLPNMARGGVFMGRLTQDQLEAFRPLPELAHCRTPIRNLYLCGACLHPGGGIIGAAGFIAAHAIADDLGVRRWWEG
ncbi:MAG: NAD(P)/FAD-dependent oxidoreductase [Deltaproteobacteria bacterium]|nr:NAD(P)/FAD-dependent oxidoreductase [Deltaproteobacteria bacterium]MBI3079370.1 NAD(P)/FAD-dependent oxidoreductase [Deltaproteobacteria bacterium]